MQELQTLNAIDFKTFASKGNASDFGNLSQDVSRPAGMASDQVKVSICWWRYSYVRQITQIVML